MENKIKFKNNENNFGLMEDSSDSDESPEEKKLMKKYKKLPITKNRNQEVYQFESEDDDDDDGNLIENSDLEDDNENDDIPDSKAWGNKRLAFHGTSFNDPDFGSYTARDEQLALEEEEEAKSIQQRLAQELNEADFSLDIYSTNETADQTTEKFKAPKIKPDLNDLSKRDKMQLFQKESPEFQGLQRDFENSIEECNEILKPILEYSKMHEINFPAFKFIETKYKIILNYITNIAFYFLLKSNRTPVKNHPIIERLVQQRQLILQLNEKYAKSIKSQIEQLCDLIKNGEELKILQSNDYFIGEDMSKDICGSKMSDDDEMIEENENGDQRRQITYQIAKNKGLTPHRKKELRNPRVKHRNKFKKALIRRKGAVRTVQVEKKRYTGEISGIKATVKKGIKIKT